jgi:hypothetical protein
MMFKKESLNFLYFHRRDHRLEDEERGVRVSK